MRSNMAEQNLTPENPTEEELMQQEERCRRARKAVAKAILMRLVVTGLLIWVAVQSAMKPWMVGLMAFVLIVNLSGLLPLVAELRSRSRELKHILSQYE